MATDNWWTTLLPDTLDPITLEPLSALACPPFELKADVSSSSTSDWFDGRALALYLVSSGNFHHPISRRELERHEVTSLDAHLQRHGLARGVTSVAHVFDSQSEARRTGGSLPEQVAAARAEQAEMLRRWLYQQQQQAQIPRHRHRNVGPSLVSAAAAPPALAVRNVGPTRSARAARREAARASSEAAACRREGGLTFFDDVE